MLYRFTLTVNINENDENIDANLDKLKKAIKGEAEWIGTNANITIEDENCIQTNKKRLAAPIITTLDTNTFPQEKNVYLSTAKLLMENLKQLKETTPHSDYQMALTTAINCLIEKSATVNEGEN